LDWAISREAELARPFLRPLVVDEEALTLLNDSITSRRYLKCLSFSEEGIASLARSLSSELFAWLAKEVERARDRNRLSTLGVLRDAEATVHGLAEAIKAVVHPHRSTNPLSIADLRVRLNSLRPSTPLALEEIRDLLDTLQRQNLLSGVAYDDEFIYLSEERYSFKSRLHLDLKRRVARKAVEMVRTGDHLALDGGSTVLELTHQLISRLKGGALKNISIVTHFIPAAYLLLNMLSDQGLGDINSVCTVYVAGGRARPISLTLISAGNLLADLKTGEGDVSLEDGAGIRGMLEALGGVDMAFLGTNGVFLDKWFAVSNPHEVFAKRLMLQHARQRVILADASKFAVQLNEPFAFFEQGLTIITAPDPEYSHALEDARQAIEPTSSSLVFA